MMGGPVKREKVAKVSIALPPRVHQALREAAWNASSKRKCYVSVSALIREALSKALGIH